MKLDVLTRWVRLARDLADIWFVPANVYRRLAVPAVQSYFQSYLLQSPQTVILWFPVLVHKYPSVVFFISLRLLQQGHK